MGVINCEILTNNFLKLKLGVIIQNMSGMFFFCMLHLQQWKFKPNPQKLEVLSEPKHLQHKQINSKTSAYGNKTRSLAHRNNLYQGLNSSR